MDGSITDVASGVEFPNGAVWARCFNTGEFVTLEDRKVTGTVAFPGAAAVSCVVGGDLGNRLFMTVYNGSVKDLAGHRRKAAIYYLDLPITWISTNRDDDHITQTYMCSALGCPFALRRVHVTGTLNPDVLILEILMHPVLAFPPLEGMTYPRLNDADLMQVVHAPADVAALPTAARDSVRVLMTSASRGCTSAMIDALPNLGFVISQGVGQDLIDIVALAERGIRLRSVGEASSDDVADLAMTLVQALCRDLVRADAFARNGQWAEQRFPVGESVVGMTIGIGGLSGRIGQAISRRAQVCRMNVAGLDRPSNAGLGAELFEDWEELAAASDVLVLAVPGSSELTHVIGAAELKALGPKGRLINVGRGNLVDTNALVEALEKREVAGAALDVLEGEPRVPARLAALPNVILTPHIGAQTWGQRARGARIAEDEVLAYLGQAERNQ